ncbi:MAG: ATP-dependent DNA helicase RecG [Patescibacteria group bacterium]|nr:ATP-dependent DNA helicase RecG [Patescibacteria group bacterium]MCL5432072.1 ATP-dependent DNA helicase RecG [Patescibacteria group bacterium]
MQSQVGQLPSKIPFVGPVFAKRLEKLGIYSADDLLHHLPFRYDNFAQVAKIASLQEGETVTVQGKILEIKNQYTRRGFVLQQAKMADDSGTLDVIWFNQPFLTRILHTNDPTSLSGKIEKKGNKLILKSPKYEHLASREVVSRSYETTSQEMIHTGRLVPVYPETQGISSKWLRNKIHHLLATNLDQRLHQVHFPDSLEQAEQAREQLAFEELQAAFEKARKRKEEWQQKAVGRKFKIVEIRDQLTTFVKNLPFSLTGAQKRVINEIYKDLAREVPMNRLLQGDVGSGKTVVAALAMLAAHLNGFQSALMAPTEILAQQHYQTLTTLLAPLKIGVGLATGASKDYVNYDVIVGTHALIADQLKFKNLGLAVIDEQHRFGVEQRGKLAAKGKNPHVLTMTATPIPRTVALTLYGDQDMSVLDEMPPGRKLVKTWLVPPGKRDAAYQWIKDQHSQAFIICPLIEDSETLADVKAVKSEYARLQKEIFPNLKLGLLHGQVKDKDKIIDSFRRKKTDILVATPVVEVGLDIPDATIMLIEAADRFGLAQLHQLRGRVGRAGQQAYCLLFSDNSAASQRLKCLEKVNNGLELAEIDLKLRGPGQRFGASQHGQWELKIATLADLQKFSTIKA